MALVCAATPPVDYRAGSRDVARRVTVDSDDNVWLVGGKKDAHLPLSG
jgi:hypothetical protein